LLKDAGRQQSGYPQRVLGLEVPIGALAAGNGPCPKATLFPSISYDAGNAFLRAQNLSCKQNIFGNRLLSVEGGYCLNSDTLSLY
jgi:hypothetical protein